MTTKLFNEVTSLANEERGVDGGNGTLKMLLGEVSSPSSASPPHYLLCLIAPFASDYVTSLTSSLVRSAKYARYARGLLANALSYVSFPLTKAFSSSGEEDHLSLYSSFALSECLTSFLPPAAKKRIGRIRMDTRAG